MLCEALKVDAFISGVIWLFRGTKRSAEDKVLLASGAYDRVEAVKTEVYMNGFKSHDAYVVRVHAVGGRMIERFGEPERIEDLDNHSIVSLGGDQPSFILDLHRLTHLGRSPKDPRPSRLVVNDSLALRQAIENGAGIGMAPDYAMSTNPRVKQVLRDEQMPTLDSYLVYPEEMRSVARVQVFRDFLVSKAQRWDF